MRRLFVLAAVCWMVACGDDDSTLQPAVGTLQITTVTTGTPTAEFTIIVDGASPRVIGPSATLSITDVDEGSHVVQLTLPTGCTAGRRKSPHRERHRPEHHHRGLRGHLHLTRGRRSSADLPAAIVYAVGLRAAGGARVITSTLTSTQTVPSRVLRSSASPARKWPNSTATTGLT